LHPFYRDAFGYVPEDFPNATKAYQRIISLPIYTGMADRHISRIIEVVRDVAQASRNS
jgi:perosamine synthetase